MNFDVMRQKLLERALKGELVPQLDHEPEVEQAAEVPKEAPFVIPEKWKWLSIDELANVVRGGSPRPINDFLTDDDDGINWIKIGDAERGIPRITHCAQKITREGVSKSRFVPKGSLLLTNSMSYGHPYILDVDGCIHDGWLAFSNFDQLAHRDYLYYFFLSSYCQTMFASKVSGSVVKNLNIQKVKSVLIPIPPLDEQHRIVAKLKTTLEIIDKAEKAYSELVGSLSERFRSLCLERAIKGELVPQLVEEPAVEQIGEVLENAHFTIPEKWKWVQLKSIGTIIGGGTPKTNNDSYWSNGSINWFTPADLGETQGDYATESRRKITPKGLQESSAKLMPPGSILFSSRAPIGHIAISTTECRTNQGCKSFVPNNDMISTEWAYYAIHALTDEIKSRASGTTFKEISGKEMGKTWIPLPPLEEQRRIVEKLNALFKDLDRLTR